MTAKRDPQSLQGAVLSGFLLALLGAILPGSNYNVTEKYASAGWLFFGLAVGAITAGEVGRAVLAKLSPRHLRITGCALAAVSLAILNMLPAPVRFAAQLTGWTAIGFATGLIDLSLFESIHDRIYFGAGCLASAVFVAAAVHWGYFSQILGILAIAPAMASLFYLRHRDPPPSLDPQLGLRQAVRQFSTPGALILAALLLFQSGSEWTVAGWLPLFLTHRLGVSPETALWMLAFYWLALLLGRIANIFLLTRARHGRILFSSAAAALLGCLLLVSTDNVFGAAVSIGLLGVGFAAIYPLLAEKMGDRFPQGHSGAFNSIFSLALSGGLLFPWFAGLLAESVSLTAIVAIPAIGVFLVVALLLVLWLESKVTGR